MKILKKNALTTTQIIAFGFLGAIIVGTILLMLPISTRAGEETALLDAFFTATSSTCVTGLTVVSTANHWSTFGHIVIICLVQLGGLGVITFTTLLLLVLRKKITLKERILIQDAYNLDTLSGVVKLTITILKGALIVEGIGAVLYAIVYVPRFGFFPGVGKAAFNAISAFCNAGMDLLGDNSLTEYRGNVLININTMLLIIIGGIGFPVWADGVRILKMKVREKVSVKILLRKMEFHSKLVLCITAILILGGTVTILLLEWNNPKTIGLLPIGDKVMASLFQSVTTRTAGFFTIPQTGLTNATSFVCILLMFIGGSPSGTAGGVKTVTIGMMLLAVISIVKGDEDTEVFHRRITESYIKKGMAVILISLSTLIMSIIGLSITEEYDFLSIAYEATSAIATAGLTKNLTSELTPIGQLIIIVSMYIGRIGPISLALFFNSKHKKRLSRQLPTEKIIVG